MEGTPPVMGSAEMGRGAKYNRAPRGMDAEAASTHMRLSTSRRGAYYKYQ
jgi:hypothetical protein